MADLNTLGGLHYEIMRRCYNSQSATYRDYGAKGIIVCEEWHDRDNFRKWAHENGYVKGLRLQRRDSKGNYEPNNCFFGEAYKRNLNSGSQNQKKHHSERMKKKESAGIKGKISDDELYKTYYSMHTRCENQNHVHYSDYGGRGVSVCPAWSGENGFFAFREWASTQERAENYTLDRIDNNGDYCPENCRFSDVKTQINNRRTSRNYMQCGVLINLAEISRKTGIRYGELRREVIKNELQTGDSIDFIIKKLEKTNY